MSQLRRNVQHHLKYSMGLSDARLGFSVAVSAGAGLAEAAGEMEAGGEAEAAGGAGEPAGGLSLPLSTIPPYSDIPGA